MTKRKVKLQLNPDLDPRPFREIYEQHSLVQIPNLLPEESAHAIHELLAKFIEWRLAFAEEAADTAVTVLDRNQIQAMGPEAFAEKMRSVHKLARENIGYLYNFYPMINTLLEGSDPGHPIHEVTKFLNSPAFLEFGREVVGAEKITQADAQATLYAPDNFLTRHVDRGLRQERRAAYTLGFTPHWEPDWGGLLMFIDDNRDVSEAYLPRFNTLTLFDGMRLHAVSSVTRFVGAGRYQITGWLRDDPPPWRTSNLPESSANA